MKESQIRFRVILVGTNHVRQKSASDEETELESGSENARCRLVHPFLVGTHGVARCSDLRLSGHLDGVPRAAERRGVAQVHVVELLDCGVLKTAPPQRCRSVSIFRPSKP